MSATLSPVPKLQFFDANGAPLVGGKLYSYIAGTTTPLSTYTDSTGTTSNTNPVILDARGEAGVWLADDSFYKLALYTADNVLVWTVDQIASNTTLAALAASGGSALVGYLSSGTGAVATTVQSKLRESVSVKDFGAVGDGVTDVTAAINAVPSFPAGFPAGVYKISADIAGLGKQFVGNGGVSFTAPYKVRSSVAYGIGALSKNVGYNPATPSVTDKNVAVGTYSLYNNTTGYHNTAVGDEALFTNVTGSQNTSVGMNALFYNTGNNNTAVGTSALLNTSTGNDNVAVGRAAGQGNTTGSSNTLVGRNVGWQKATGDNDTAVGYECYWDSTASGGSNSAFGFRAAYRLTTGARNTTLGNESGYNIGAATDVVAVGHRAAFTTTANEIVAVGNLSLNLLTTGVRNTALGFRAGEAITTVTDNTFVGWRAGYLATSAQNVIIGSQAAPVLTSGASSVIVGQSAGSALTTGFFNTFIGQNAGSNVTTGGGNTVIGRNAVASAAGVNNEITVTGGSTTLRIGGGVQWLSGAGTPEASVTAPVGSLYTRTDGGASTTLYVKESGTGNTGWVAK